jgi:hypothetical protein
MGQASNSGRGASLDDKKRRAAGRQQNDPERAAIAEAHSPRPAKGTAGGAFGSEGQANRRGGVGTRSGGGGGGEPSPAKAAHLKVGRRKTPARKGGI